MIILVNFSVQMLKCLVSAVGSITVSNVPLLHHYLG